VVTPAPSPVVIALSDALVTTAEALQVTADALTHGSASSVDGARLVLLAGPLLAALAEVEREAHRLRAFAAPPRNVS
jgi:hypothetical protein